MTYFNEIDPFAAQWCRNAFPNGDVDERDIREIAQPVVAIRQHYFAGLGGWEWALRLAGWPADQEIWTGSCPCQPFSVAGKGQAHEDERDLWPAFFRLIAIARPAVIIGEQVNGAITYGWLDRVCDDLEGIGYAVGATVLPASGVGAPHIRQRLYWVAVAKHDGRGPDFAWRGSQGRAAAGGSGEADGVAHTASGGASQHSSAFEPAQRESRPCSDADGLADSGGARLPRAGEHRSGPSPLSARSEQRGDDGGLELPALDRREQGWPEPERGRAEPRRDLGGMGDTDRAGQEGWDSESGYQSGQLPVGDASETGGLGNTDQARPEGRDLWGVIPEQGSDQLPARATGETGGMAHSAGTASPRHRGVGRTGLPIAETGSPWAASRSIWCQDGRYRRVPLEPSLQPLADSGRFGNPRTDRNLSSRIGALQAAGNAIVIPLAAEFVRAVMDIYFS